jgi:hypothetical protein
MHTLRRCTQGEEHVHALVLGPAVVFVTCFHLQASLLSSRALPLFLSDLG